MHKQVNQSDTDPVQFKPEVVNEMRKAADELQTFLGINKSFFSETPPDDWADREDAIKLMNDRAYELAMDLINNLDRVSQSQ